MIERALGPEEMPQDAFVRLEDLHKGFAGKPVLQGIDLAIHHGETMVILGASGSGKSVLLRHIIGLHRPDRGRVWVEDTEVTRLREDELVPVRKRVGMLFQGGALFDSMNVFENVAFALREHTSMGEDAVVERVREVLRMVDLEAEEVCPVMPVDLSGGMRKRVALARAIALEPRGILYDEPTTGLDPITASHINRLVRVLQRRLRVTSVVVTHDIASAFLVGDRVAFLKDGEMRFVGTVEEARQSSEPSLRRFLDAGSLEPASAEGGS